MKATSSGTVNVIKIEVFYCAGPFGPSNSWKQSLGVLGFHIPFLFDNYIGIHKNS